MAQRRLEIQFIGDPASAQRAFARVGQSASLLERKFGVMGAAANRVGTQMASLARMAALPAAAVAGASVKLAVDFDKSMRNVNSIAQLSERQFERLEGSVLKLAGPTAQAPRTLAEGLYDLVSSGFDSAESLQILEKSARAATAGLTTTEISTAAVAAVLNAYHKPAKAAGEVSDVLFRTVDRGVITFDDLASTVGDVLPFASSLGVELYEVGAATATMTKAGINAPETMTRIKNVMVSLLKPGEGLQKAFEELGVESGEALIEAEGFQGGLEALIGTTDGSKAAVAQLFPNIRSLGGALALTGDNAKGAQVDLKGMEEASGATERALSQQSKSIAFQWERVKAQASVLAIEFGEDLLPAIEDVLSVFSDPRLTEDEKLTKAVQMVIDKATAAIPAALDIGADIALALGDGFLDAWTEANPLEKALLGAAAIRLLGGRGALIASGAGIGKLLGIGVASGAAGVAGGAGGAAAGGGIAGGIGRTLKGVKWARVGALSVGVPLAAGIFEELGQKAEAGTDDLFERLSQLGEDGGKNLGETISEGVADAFTFGLIDEWDSEVRADEVKASVAELAGALQSIQGGAGLSADEVERLSGLLESLPDISPEAKAQGDALLRLGGFAGRLHDSFDHAYNLKDIRAKFTSELAVIRANFGQGTTETKQLSQTAFRAMAGHVGAMVKDSRLSLDDAKRFLKQFGGSVEDLGAEFQPMSSKAVTALKDVTHNSSLMRRDASEQFDRMSDNARDAFHQTGKDAERELNKLPRIMDKAMGATRRATDRGGQEIRASLLKQLSDYGISDPEGFITRSQSVNAAGGDSPRGKREGGPIVQVGGAGTGDIVNAVVPSGSFVVNRSAARAFGFRGGGVPVRLEPEELIFPPELAGIGEMMNSAVPRQKGGAVGQVVEALGPVDMPPFRYDANHAGTNRHLHLAMSSSAAIVAFGKKLQAAGYMVGEHPAFGGIQGSHDPDGYHPTGQAIDINTANDETLAEIRKVVAMLGGAAVGGVGGGMGAINLKLPRFAGRGLIGAGGAEGLNRMAGGLEQVIGKRLARREGAESGLNMSGSYKGPLNRVFPEHSLAAAAGHVQLSEAQVDELRRKAGLPPVFNSVVNRESVRYPGVIGDDAAAGFGNTFGYGLAQITSDASGKGPPNGDIIQRLGGRRQMFNPWKNLQAARMILDRQPTAWGSSGFDSISAGVVSSARRGGIVGEGSRHGTNPERARFWMHRLLHDVGSTPENVAGWNSLPDGLRTRWASRLRLRVNPLRFTVFEDGALAFKPAFTKGLRRGGRSNMLSGTGRHGQRWSIRGTGGTKLPQQTTLSVGTAEHYDAPYSYEELLILNDIAMTQAQGTEGFEDDLAALTGRESLIEKRKRQIERKLRKPGLKQERRAELLGELSSLTSELGSVREQMAEGDDATQSLIDAITAQAEEMKALKDAIAEQNAMIKSTQQIHSTELLRALGDVISGELGGRTFNSALTAGSGSVVAA